MTNIVDAGGARLSKGVWETVQKLRNIADSFEREHMASSAGAMREAVALISELEGKLRRKREVVAREEPEIAALKHDLQRSMSRENCYLNALMRICNNEENPAEIAEHAMYGEGPAAARAFEERLITKALPGETRDQTMERLLLASAALGEMTVPEAEVAEIVAAIAMEASGRDGETRLDAEHDSAGRRHRTGDSA